MADKKYKPYTFMPEYSPHVTDYSGIHYKASKDYVYNLGLTKKRDPELVAFDKGHFNRTMDGNPEQGRLMAKAFEHAITSQAKGDRNIRPELVGTLAPFVAAAAMAEGKGLRHGRAWGELAGGSEDKPYIPKSNDPRSNDPDLTTGYGAYLRQQAGWNASGAQKTWDSGTIDKKTGEWKAGPSRPLPKGHPTSPGWVAFIGAWGNRRTKPGASNDPTGSNENFIPNMLLGVPEIHENQKKIDKEHKELKSVGRLRGVQKWREQEVKDAYRFPGRK